MDPQRFSAARLIVMSTLVISLVAPFSGLIGDPAVGWVVLAMSAMAVVVSDTTWRHLVDVPGPVRRNARMVEVAGLVVGSRFALLAVSDDPIREIAGWPRGLLSGEGVVVAAIMAAAWAVVALTLSDLERLRVARAGAGGGAQHQLLVRFLAGGVVLLAAGAVDAVGWDLLFEIDRGLLGETVLPALLYFPLGLVALSVTKLTAHRSRWDRDGAVVEDDVETSWARTAFAIVGLALVAVMVLPVGRTFIVVQVVERTARTVASFVGGLAPGSGGAETRIEDLPVAQDNPIGLPEPGPQGEALPDVLGPIVGVLSWILLIGLLVLLLWAVIGAGAAGVAGRDGGRRRRLLGLAQLLGWLPRSMWRSLSTLWALRRRERAAVTQALQAGRTKDAPPDRSPRARVRAAYRALLVAADASVSVRSADTPAEYGGRLSSSVPGTAERLGLLTGLYVVARYSHHEIGEGEADAAYQHAAALASRLEDARAGNDSPDD